ncbi:MAG: cyclic nucleotide-binding domain-containing protein [Desulfopila sp.]|jgi:CRP-like cAMP-binding protein|nr:cyclic nucleotide-binding domain-containing protein [Desulfopila sp.]
MSSSTKTQSNTVSSECKLTCDFEILQKSPVFGGADTEVLKLFAYLAKRKKYHPGSEIIAMENEAEAAYYLISGKAELTTMHHGNKVVLQHLTPQTFFGELALLARFKWFFSVQAVEPCEVMIITRESFKKVLENFPNRRERLVEKIVQLRVERLMEQTAFLLDKVPSHLLGKTGPAL